MRATPRAARPGAGASLVPIAAALVLLAALAAGGWRVAPLPLLDDPAHPPLRP